MSIRKVRAKLTATHTDGSEFAEEEQGIGHINNSQLIQLKEERKDVGKIQKRKEIRAQPVTARQGRWD